MKKSDVLALLGDVPDDAEIDAEKLMYWLWVKQKIEKSETDIAAGDVYSQEEIEREIRTWQR